MIPRLDRNRSRALAGNFRLMDTVTLLRHLPPLQSFMPLLGLSYAPQLNGCRNSDRVHLSVRVENQKLPRAVENLADKTLLLMRHLSGMLAEIALPKT
jgi:hypothetical protein